MGAGYFDDGAVSLALGDHVFGTAGTARRSVSIGRPYEGAVILDSGGGALSVELTAQQVRASRGDAERYIYGRLAALGGSDAGALGFEDNRGYRHVYGDAVCASARGEVQGMRFAEISLSFACPEKSVEPAWGAVPAAPGTYPGCTNAQDYAAGGVALGVGGSMRIEMQRAASMREIPRARGSRVSPPWAGAAIRFTVTAAQVANLEDLPGLIEDLVRSIGPRPVDLTANGNTYCDVLLDGVSVRQTDTRYTMLDFIFVRGL